ncbi:MAG: hypothetical protein KAR05_03755 [Candidatus Omnitrophica bacterium]|nr:hypothetical protein [Candidatus Omnitrophota bacterium]
MKRLFILLLIIGIYLVAVTMHVLNTPEYTQYVLRWLVKKYYPQYSIQSLNLSTQRFVFVPGITIGGFQIVLSSRDGVNPVYINLDRLSVIHASGPEFQVDMHGGEIRQGKLAVKGINVTALLSVEEKVAAVGAVQVQEAVNQGLALQNVIAEFSLNQRSIKLTDFAASAYEGKMTGEITVEYSPQILYSISVDIGHVDTQNCGGLHPQIPVLVDGVLEGSFNISGSQDGILEVSSDLQLKRGGKIKASFFEPIIKSFPENVKQRQDLETVLRQDGKIPIEKAQITITDWQKNNFSGLIHLKSQRLNIDLKQPLDITLDEDINVVIRKWQKFSWVMNDVYKIIMSSLSVAIKSYYESQPN